MKYTIRQGVFETNSSSTHATVFVDKNDYSSWIADKSFLWIKGELDQYSSTEIYDPEFIDVDKAIELVINNNEDLKYYYMEGVKEKDYPEKLREMIQDGKYRPFVEVGIIPYDAKTCGDSGMIQFDDHEELTYKRIVELEFMI